MKLKKLYKNPYKTFYYIERKKNHNMLTETNINLFRVLIIQCITELLIKYYILSLMDFLHG